MNKYILITLMVFCFGIFAGSAMAGTSGNDALAAPDFFYGVTIDQGHNAAAP